MHGLYLFLKYKPCIDPNFLNTEKNYHPLIQTKSFVNVLPALLLAADHLLNDVVSRWSAANSRAGRTLTLYISCCYELGGLYPEYSSWYSPLNPPF